MRVFPVFLPQRGCSHRCLFCDQARTTERSAPLTIERVRNDLESMVDGAGEGEIAYYGGTFTLLPEVEQKALLDTARIYVESGRVSGIRVSTRPDALESRQIQFLLCHGVTTVEVGAQSFDNHVLCAAGRGHDAAASITAARRLRQTGLQLGLQLMPGLPGGDRNEALFSLERAIEADPDFLRIYPTVVFPDTPLASLWQQGFYQPWSLEQAVDVCADMLALCRRHNLPVVRLGLQQVASLAGRGVLAGPHHPAFGQLVRSRLWRRALCHALGEGTVRPEIRVHPSDLADALGHCRGNLDFLRGLQPKLAFEASNQVPREHFICDGELFSVDSPCENICLRKNS